MTVDFKNFWNNKFAYEKEATIGEPLTDEMVSRAEEKLGFKLPKSYIELMKTQNGGRPNRNCWSGSDVDETDEYDIMLNAFFSISETKKNSLFGEFSNEFWFEQWGYPSDIGVIIADTTSGGHEMIYLDYRDCTKDGEPKVSICFQDDDFEIVTIANTFEEFISQLYED